MAHSFFQSTWNTAGTNSGTGAYKDVTVTGAQVGDLLVAFGSCESVNTGTTRVITTQSGSTEAWVPVSPAVVNNADADFIAASAKVLVAGTIIVRVQVRPVIVASDWMGAGVTLIPAAEVGATYGFVGTGFVADADGQSSITLGGSSSVIYMAGDWNATAITANAGTPASGTPRVRFTDGSHYSVFAMGWLTQAAGTRNYGPTGLSGGDWSGAVFRMDTPAAGNTGTAASVLPALTQAAAGEVDVPVFTGTAASVLPGLTQAAAGEVDAPQFTGTAASVLPALTQSAAGETDVPVFTGVAASVLPALTQAAAGETDVPVFTGAIASTLPALTQVGAGTVEPPEFTGEISSALPALTQSAAGTVDNPPSITGDIASVLPALTQSATGESIPPEGVVGEISSVLPVLGQSAEGTVTLPIRTGVIASALPALTQSATGTSGAPEVTGVIQSVLPALTQNATNVGAVCWPAMSLDAVRDSSTLVPEGTGMTLVSETLVMMLVEDGCRP